MNEPCHRCRGTGREPDWRGLGLKVRAAREAKSLTLREAARRIRVSGSYICDLELGRRSWQGPKARALLALVGVRGSLPPTTGAAE